MTTKMTKTNAIYFYFKDKVKNTVTLPLNIQLTIALLNLP